MNDLMLRADCARCAALCCVAFAFDRSVLFAFDKPAGVPCPNLDRCDRCRVHERLDAEGLSGCRAYDCAGAGQRVTAMFAGHSWRDDAATQRQMLEAFAVMREVCELLSLLNAARALRLPAPLRAECLALLRGFEAEARWTFERLESYRLRCVRVFAALRAAADRDEALRRLAAT